MGNEMNELRYLDLKNALCEKIYKGIYKDGKKIPSERQLSTDYEVSRITVRKTLELMEKENLIVREVGNGTRVTLKNYGNANPLDVVALTAPSRNPFFANFTAMAFPIPLEAPVTSTVFFAMKITLSFNPGKPDRSRLPSPLFYQR